MLQLPALLATITDLDGWIVGSTASGSIPTNPVWLPLWRLRRTLGGRLGGGMHFGETADTLVAGEGLETALSLKVACPDLLMVAALTAAILPPWRCQRRSNGFGSPAMTTRPAATPPCERAEAETVAASHLVPVFSDFNNDLGRLRASVCGIFGTMRR